MPVPLLATPLAAASGLLVLLGGLEIFYRTRDRATIVLLRRTSWQELPAEGAERRFGCRLEFSNRNHAYELTLKRLAGTAQILMRGGISSMVTARVCLTALNADGRRDGYWASTLVAPDGRLEVDLTVTFAGAPEELEALHAAVVGLRWEVYGRRLLEAEYSELILPLAAPRPVSIPSRERAGATLFPIATHLLGDTDDIAEVIARYTAGVGRPGDVVAVAESVVAVTQGRFRRPERIRPGFWARRLCLMVPSKGSLSSPYGMQAAMDEEGTARVVLAFFLGALGKLLGRSGWFYALAGRQANLIDDVTGTMPPYDQYVVPGPGQPDRVVEAIKARTGLEAAIVDVNDLSRALVVAATRGVDRRALAEALLDNPHGNDHQQTPIVLVRPQRAEAPPEREGVI